MVSKFNNPAGFNLSSYCEIPWGTIKVFGFLLPLFLMAYQKSEQQIFNTTIGCVILCHYIIILIAKSDDDW